MIRRRGRWRQLGLVVAGLACVSFGRAQTSLDSVVVRLEPAAGDRIVVTLTGSLRRPLAAGEELLHRAILPAGQQLRLLSATVDAEPVRLESEAARFSVTARLAGPVRAGYSLTWEVVRNSDPRVPMLVPQVPVAQAVTLTVEPAVGLRPGPGAFPEFDGGLSTSLANVPGLLYLPLEPLAGSGNSGIRLTVGTVTDAGLFLIVAAATVFWWRLRKRAIAEAGSRSG